MTALTTADLIPAFRALETIAETHPELPYATFNIRGTTLAAEQVIEVQIDRDLTADFEAWVTAFEMLDEQVVTRPMSSGFGYSTRAVTRYAGVTWVIWMHHRAEQWRPTREAVAA